MKLFKIIFIASILMFNTQLIFAQTGRIKAPNGVNLRTGKGTNYKIITSIPNHEKIKISSKEGNWWKVIYGGKEGYISSKYVTEQHGKEREREHEEEHKKHVLKIFKNRNTENNYVSNTNTSINKWDWGVGVRLGDPSGITLKKYSSNGTAIEVSFGRTLLLQHKSFYKNNFNSWYANQNYNYRKYDYLGSNASAPLGVQIHYLIQNELFKSEIEGLYWYYGAGGQLSYRSYTYDYRYKLQGGSDWIYNTGNRVTSVVLGADGVIGAEYFMPNIPVSFFADFTLSMEVYSSPFLFYTNEGIGARYNF